MAFLGDDGRLDDVTQEALDSVGKGGGGPIPAGWYRAALVEDEAQPKSWGVGLNMQFQILEGDYAERRVFDYLCVRHSTSAKAEEIARAKLKAFAIACGAKDPNNVTDTAPFYGRPVMMEVRRVKDETKYAEEDGKKARIADFLSVKEYRETVSGAPKETASKPASRPAPAPEDDEPPF